ncbi:MAG: DUF5615 family PIN-like protein [Bacteroidota bacterium]
MLKFIIDTQLPYTLVKRLKALGADAIHTTYFSDGHLLDDYQIIEIAIEQGRIIITKDSDFQDNFLLKGTPPKILLLKLGNISNKDLFAMIEAVYNDVSELFEGGNGMVVLSKNSVIGYE